MSSVAIAGYAALFDIPDGAKDTIRKGAFARTLAQREAPLPLYWEHDARQRIGTVTHLAEDERGLRVIARIERGDSRAAHLLLQGETTGLSFGYRARGLANAAAERASASRETVSWRTAELDPALAPGAVVQVPGRPGTWRIEQWEWRENGVELGLSRVSGTALRNPPADAGQALPAPDLLAAPTLLVAYELPWDGSGSMDQRQAFAAVSSHSAGWTGAALYVERDGGLEPIGSNGRRRSTIGHTLAEVPRSDALRWEAEASLDIELASADFMLSSVTIEALASGANRALVGGEVLQFGRAVQLGEARWRLHGLLRGRGGTEAAALAGHPAGAAFVLLDDSPLALDGNRLPATGARILALGLVDEEPVGGPLANEGLTLRPLPPVHPRIAPTAAGGLDLGWTRRSRGAWSWPSGIDAPLNEQAEAYLVGLGDPAMPLAVWQLGTPRLELSPQSLAQLAADHPRAPLWVRQIGTHAASDPLLLTTLP